MTTTGRSAWWISSGARFQLKVDAAKRLVWVTDSERPGTNLGLLNISSSEPKIYEPHSIVIRETVKLSLQNRVVLSGTGEQGIVAAAEVVSDRNYLNEFDKRAPKG